MVAIKKTLRSAKHRGEGGAADKTQTVEVFPSGASKAKKRFGDSPWVATFKDDTDLLGRHASVQRRVSGGITDVLVIPERALYELVRRYREWKAALPKN